VWRQREFQATSAGWNRSKPNRGVVSKVRGGQRRHDVSRRLRAFHGLNIKVKVKVLFMVTSSISANRRSESTFLSSIHLSINPSIYPSIHPHPLSPGLVSGSRPSRLRQTSLSRTSCSISLRRITRHSGQLGDIIPPGVLVFPGLLPLDEPGKPLKGPGGLNHLS